MPSGSKLQYEVMLVLMFTILRAPEPVPLMPQICVGDSWLVIGSKTYLARNSLAAAADGVQCFTHPGMTLTQEKS